MLSLTRYQAVGVDVVAWAAIGVAVGYGMHRVPVGRFVADGTVTRLRRVERGGRLYEAVGVRRWKDRLPDAGGLFRGGVDKRTTGGPDRYRTFVAETCRAELTHWIVIAAAPLFALWNPWYLTVAMGVYAVVANVPCIVVQRYNRGRLLRILDQRAVRSG